MSRAALRAALRPSVPVVPTRPGSPARPAARRPVRALRPVTALLAGLVLAGCAGGADGAEVPDPGASAAPAADALRVEDPWVKAVDAADGMTAAFGVLHNDSAVDVRLVSASSSVAGLGELHEMAEADGGATVMRQKAGGIVVPAGGEHALVPGGDHVMLMDLRADVLPGQDVTVVLTADDGSTLEVVAPARSFAGADEEYAGGDHADGGGDDDATGHDS